MNKTSRYHTQAQANKSKSPPSMKSPKMTFIQGINKYRSIFTPVISSQNRKLLQAKLAIEKQSTAATSQRLLNNNYYVTYQTNPFTNIKSQKHKFSNPYSTAKSSNSVSLSPSFNSAIPHSHTPQKLKPLPKKKPSLVPQPQNLIQAVSNIKSPKSKLFMERRIRNYEKINNLLMDSKKVSNIITTQYNKEKSQKSSVSFQVSSTKDQIKDFVGMTDQEKESIKLQRIEDINGMVDTNHYFNQGRKRLNIFKCAANDDYLTNPIQQLDLHKFQIHGVIERINKSNNMRLPIARDMSRISRYLIQGKKVQTKEIVDLLVNEELIIKGTQLGFYNVMSMASGRLSNQVVNYLDEEFAMHANINNKQMSQTSSQQSLQVLIPYPPQVTNTSQNAVGERQDKNQIKQFSHIQLTRKQKKQQQKYQQLRQKIKKLLQKKKQAYQFGIEDKEWLRQHDGKILSSMEGFFGGVKKKEGRDEGSRGVSRDASIKSTTRRRVDGDGEDIASLVRKNKKGKLREQSFRLVELNSTMKYKNQFDQKMNKGFQTVRNKNQTKLR